MESAMAKISISLTEDHARMIEQAVQSGDYASSSEVIREALREWRIRRRLGQLWDEGVASGMADAGESIEDIKAAARRGKGTDSRHAPRQKISTRPA